MKLDPSQITDGFEPLTNAERQVRKRRSRGIKPRQLKYPPGSTQAERATLRRRANGIGPRWLTLHDAEIVLAVKTREELLASGWHEIKLQSGQVYWGHPDNPKVEK